MSSLGLCDNKQTSDSLKDRKPQKKIIVLCCQLDWKNDFYSLTKTQTHNDIEIRWLGFYYPGGQTQPGMHGVLGEQVRFNIRLRQVGAQATPPLCLVQLRYTFPSGHSPTSPLSGSTTYMNTLKKTNASVVLKINCDSYPVM